VDWARWLWQSDNADINVLRHALSNDLHVFAACSGPSSML
jgi:putative intracellular protease/amidase